jgi:hypothetical protein
MALVISGKTICAISGRVITSKNKVVCLPPFPTHPDDPTTTCSDACVLRDEFEGWRFRNDVIELVAKTWLQQYHASEAFEVVYEDDEYLFVIGKAEQKLRILFLKYAFVIDVPLPIWRDFCTSLLSMQDAVTVFLYSTIVLKATKKLDKVEIRIDVKGSGWDCIELSMSEWSRFEEILIAGPE